MPDEPFPPLPVDPEYCVVSRRNDSLTSPQRWTVFACLASVSLGFAVAFCVAGAWPILPWSMVEVSVLATAFVVLERRSGDCERLAIAGDRVIVDRVRAGRRERREYNRFWLRVSVDMDGRAPRVALAYRGRAEEVGALLPGDDRVAFGRELRRRLGDH